MANTWDERYDFNMDGVINILDYSLLLKRAKEEGWTKEQFNQELENLKQHIDTTKPIPQETMKESSIWGPVAVFGFMGLLVAATLRKPRRK